MFCIPCPLSRAPPLYLVPYLLDCLRPPMGGVVKLPKHTIQPLSGDLTTWTPFWELYRAAIHDNPSLTDTEKFNYLRSLLEHSALDAISGFSLTAPNYKEAVSVLEKHFGNKQQIVTKHMDALMNLNTVTSSTNIVVLCRLYDHVESHNRSLKSLGVEFGSYGGLLASVLLNKLLQLLVSRKIGESESKLDEIYEWSGRKSKPVSVQWQQPHQPLGGRARNRRQLQSCLLEVVVAPHVRIASRRIPQIPAKLVVNSMPALQKAGHCFVCLQKGHISRECHSRAKCLKCGGKQHFLMECRPLQRCFICADTINQPLNSQSVESQGCRVVNEAAIHTQCRHDCLHI